MKKLSNTMKMLSIPTLLLFLLTFGVGSTFAAQSCGTNIDQCTINLADKNTATTNYPTDLSTTLDGGKTVGIFLNHTITWNGCTPSATCTGPVSFSYDAKAAGSAWTVEISLTGTGTWDPILGAIQYSVTGGSCTVAFNGQPQSTAAVLD